MESTHIAHLMARLREGDQQAVGPLFELCYPELRRLAGVRMRGERAGHSWQPTTLLNELYLELLRVKSLPERDGVPDERDFYRLCAFLMRRLLIRHARPLAQRVQQTEFEEEMRAMPPAADALAEIGDLLERLGRVDARLRTVVELRVFGGFTHEEIAAQLGCSSKSVKRWWNFAQQWLAEALV